jgi:hypothetical protein
VFAVSGCGDSYDSVMKDSIKLMNEAADVFEGIKSKKDAEEAKPKLEALADKAKDISERTKKLVEKKTKDKKDKDLEEATKSALKEVQKSAEKYEEEGKKAAKRLQEAKDKAMKIEGVKDVLKGIKI